MADETGTDTVLAEAPVETTEASEVVEQTTEETTTDTTEATTPDADAPIVEIDGQQYTETQLREMYDSHTNQSKWKAEQSETGERLNAIQRALEAQVQGNSQQATPAPTPQTQTPEITGAELQSMIYDNPDQAMTTIGNLINNAVTNAIGDYSGKVEVKDMFMKDNPDFDKVVSSPEYKAFEATKPYLNQVNAYYAYQANTANQKIEEAGKNGFNDGEKATINNLKAKRGITVLQGTGASAQPAQVDIKGMSHGDLINAATRAIEANRKTGG